MRTVFLFIVILALSICAAAQQQLTVGAEAPAFSAEYLNGKPLELNDLKGKVVVMTFWSTRCLICHNEIPKLNRMADSYKGRDVVFLALTMENESIVSPYIKKNPFRFDIVPNSFGVVLKYADMDASGRIRMGFPSYYLIDRKGKINLRADGWDKTSNIDTRISQLLSE
ncbi:MAG: TlpA family protein disulfide reductase [Acidobacteria bacterium]|nr:TlpA family protein disulfide reductase [Acidobacteriota bacterium]